LLKATAIDLVRAGFQVVAVEQLCRGVTSETSAQALEEMRQEGVKLLKELDLTTIRSLL
jgi:nicotinamidase-related amidase